MSAASHHAAQGKQALRQQEPSCRQGKPTVLCPSPHARRYIECFSYLFNIQNRTTSGISRYTRNCFHKRGDHGNFALQIAAKPLQLATWLLLAAYRNLPTPYPTVPPPTLYDVPFSDST